ncbi:pseudouridine synthase [Lacticigenium naphthae]|uniref:pseudouridine synthase n=1 Tax=Lacticigenium naphthae TaxID=515351 RepID=UPI000411AC2D|nr:pseudouridine synthase [Lacticigenium naphthae]
MRIDKLLAHTGFGTRKEVKKLLKKKLVTINGEEITDPKTHTDPEKDTVLFDGEPVVYQEYIYFMLNKPAGLISATEDELHETVIDILEPHDTLQEPFPVGRLDKDTEGLLLLTNDGALAHALLSPKKHVDKRYEALVSGKVTQEDVTAFEAGVVLEDGYQTMPSQLRILSVDEEKEESRVEIVIQEGKFHQIKRMMEAVGKEVVYLKRLTMGPLELDPTLELGHYRELTKEEIDLLRNR